MSFTSSGAISVRVPGTPSTITNGSLVDMVVTPRTRIVAPADGSPLERVICTPAICPCNWLESCGVLFIRSLSPPKEEVDPVRSILRAVPYPITTTSSNVSESSSRVILYEFCELTFISTGLYPM